MKVLVLQYWVKGLHTDLWRGKKISHKINVFQSYNYLQLSNSAEKADMISQGLWYYKRFFLWKAFDPL